MSATEQDTEPLYNDQGQRLCGALRPNGKRCERLPDRANGLLCYRHAQPRGEDGKAPKRGKTWLDDRTGVDASYVDTLRLGFDPGASNLTYELELTNRHINAIRQQYDKALRDVKAGRPGRNPSTIRAELTNLVEVKTRLVKAHVQRTKMAKDYVTRDQAVVMTHLFIYLAARHVPKDRLRQFFDEARVCTDAPWKVAELTVPKGIDAREAHKQAKQLFDELWTEQRPLPNAGDDTEDSEDDEPGEHEHPYDGEESTP